jgi:3-hydroxyisobutyrate dehydrogenase-like beta-hydroxyacid dehydrogenase
VTQDIAFIGVGRMGGRMTTRLLDAGYAVSVFDPSEEALAPLIARGARAAGSPAEATAGAAFVLCSLPNPAVLHEAIAGDRGVLDGAQPGTVIIDFSTGDPSVARELADAARRQSVAFLDAPVSRGVVGAENGTLAVMVGGDEETLEAARQILDHLASDIVHVGEVGAGQMTKLCNNMLTAIITTALGEILVTGVKAGVELQPLTEALGAGSAGNYVLSGYLPNTLFTDERNAGFALSLMRKDLGLFLGAAADAGMELPLSDLVHQQYVAAHAAGLDDADSTSIAELYERAADVRLRLAPAPQEVTT